ncbi:DUF4115 domain-containing protein [Kroppenstedtia pulmonis]|uniref:DUF4115 domain-containing protein n=1 Tax=Kroppenstedtia pulmonis TaxID=1380685 RepID=A0A7D4BJW5_9BACL|nr:helix-turn-helix domain-containing protein [Kroppenstedtia pulmonis]QKG84530.1 DUF4115 domain-containing protein [Kroppenstedtia pulmonis]
MSNPIDLLRHKRERAGLTLEQVQEQIGVQAKYLQALEEGQWNQLPGKFYTRAFIKTYSQFLGVQVTPILQYYEQRVSEESGESMTEPETSSIPSRRQRMSRKKKKNAFQDLLNSIPLPHFFKPQKHLWLLLFSLVLLIPAVILFFSWGDSPESKAKEQKADAKENISGKNQEMDDESDVQLIKPSETNQFGDEYHISNAKEVVVIVEASAESSYRFRAGGPTEEITEEGTLQSGETKSFKHPKWISLTIGHPADVKLTVNGHVIDTSGESSEHAYQLRLKN